MPEPISNAERLAYWYLRLNGFLLWENFVIHPDTGSDARTDADLVGIRLMHRRDSLDEPLEDDPLVAECAAPCNVIIAEVKKGTCALNGPWTDREKENVPRVLRAIGSFEESDVPRVAEAVYNFGKYEDRFASCRLFVLGDRRSELPISGVPQVLFDHMVDFIFKRLRQFRRQKSSVSYWAEDGQKLREFANTSDLERFRHDVRWHFQVG